MQTDTRLENYTDADRLIAGRLYADHYEILMSMARQARRRSGLAATLQTADVLHETFLKLSTSGGWTSHVHFLGIVVLAMRQVIVDHARRRLALKRGGGVASVPLDEHEPLCDEFAESPADIVEIADLLNKLEAVNPRWMRIVDARYFAGLTEAETAAALGLSERTVRREWRDARDWLARNISLA